MDPNQQYQQQPPQGYPPQQQPPQGYPQQPGYPGGPQNPGKGLSIAGMVCGIVSVVFVWASALVFPIIIGIVGLVLSALGMKKSKDAGFPAGMAIAGLVCSIVAVGWNIICIACFCSTFGGTMCAAMELANSW